MTAFAPRKGLVSRISARKLGRGWECCSLHRGKDLRKCPRWRTVSTAPLLRAAFSIGEHQFRRRATKRPGDRAIRDCARVSPGPGDRDAQASRRCDVGDNSKRNFFLFEHGGPCSMCHFDRTPYSSLSGASPLRERQWNPAFARNSSIEVPSFVQQPFLAASHPSAYRRAIGCPDIRFRKRVGSSEVETSTIQSSVFGRKPVALQ